MLADHAKNFMDDRLTWRQWLPWLPLCSFLGLSNEFPLNLCKKLWQRFMLPPILQSKPRCKMVAVGLLNRLHVAISAKHDGLMDYR